jgi:hypothetical protein
MSDLVLYRAIILDAVQAGAQPLLSKVCVHCGGHTIFFGHRKAFQRWRNGNFVQDVWPYASVGDRETLISGTHSECFDEMLPPDEED